MVAGRHGKIGEHAEVHVAAVSNIVIDLVQIQNQISLGVVVMEAVMIGKVATIKHAQVIALFVFDRCLRTDLGKLWPAGRMRPLASLCPARMMPVNYIVNYTSICLFYFYFET